MTTETQKYLESVKEGDLVSIWNKVTEPIKGYFSRIEGDKLTIVGEIDKGVIAVYEIDKKDIEGLTANRELIFSRNGQNRRFIDSKDSEYLTLAKKLEETA